MAAWTTGRQRPRCAWLQPGRRTNDGVWLFGAFLDPNGGVNVQGPTRLVFVAVPHAFNLPDRTGAILEVRPLENRPSVVVVERRFHRALIGVAVTGSTQVGPPKLVRSIYIKIIKRRKNNLEALETTFSRRGRLERQARVKHRSRSLLSVSVSAYK